MANTTSNNIQVPNPVENAGFVPLPTEPLTGNDSTPSYYEAARQFGDDMMRRLQQTNFSSYRPKVTPIEADVNADSFRNPIDAVMQGNADPVDKAAQNRRDLDSVVDKIRKSAYNTYTSNQQRFAGTISDNLTAENARYGMFGKPVSVNVNEAYDFIGSKALAKYPTFTPGIDNNEMAARTQTSGEKFRRGMGKLATKTLLYGVGGTVNLLYGTLTMASQMRLSAFYDNEFMNFVNNTDEYINHSLAHYYTREEENMNFLQKMGTANFWWNDVVGSGLSFTTGAFLTAWMTGGLGLASLAGRGVSLLGRGLAGIGGRTASQVASTTIKNMFKPVIREMSRNAAVNNATRSVMTLGFGSSWESAVEANSAFKENERNYIDYFRTINGRDPSREELAEFNETNADVSNAVFAANMAIVGLSNFIQFGKYMGIGKNFFSKTVSKPIDAFQRMRDRYVFGVGVKKGANGALEAVKGNWAQKTAAMTWNVGKPMLTEGVFEEGLQGVASRTAEDYIRSRYDETYLRDTVDLFDSIRKSLGDTYTTSEGLMEVGIGAIIGGAMNIRNRFGITERRNRVKQLNQFIKQYNENNAFTLPQVKDILRNTVVMNSISARDDAASDADGNPLSLYGDNNTSASEYEKFALSDAMGMLDSSARDFVNQVESLNDLELAFELGITVDEAKAYKRAAVDDYRKKLKLYKEASRFGRSVVDGTRYEQYADYVGQVYYGGMDSGFRIMQLADKIGEVASDVNLASALKTSSGVRNKTLAKAKEVLDIRQKADALSAEIERLGNSPNRVSKDGVDTEAENIRKKSLELAKIQESYEKALTELRKMSSDDFSYEKLYQSSLDLVTAQNPSAEQVLEAFDSLNAFDDYMRNKPKESLTDKDKLLEHLVDEYRDNISNYRSMRNMISAFSNEKFKLDHLGMLSKKVRERISQNTIDLGIRNKSRAVEEIDRNIDNALKVGRISEEEAYTAKVFNHLADEIKIARGEKLDSSVVGENMLFEQETRDILANFLAERIINNGVDSLDEQEKSMYDRLKGTVDGIVSGDSRSVSSVLKDLEDKLNTVKSQVEQEKAKKRKEAADRKKAEEEAKKKAEQQENAEESADTGTQQQSQTEQQHEQQQRDLATPAATEEQTGSRQQQQPEATPQATGEQTGEQPGQPAAQPTPEPEQPTTPPEQPATPSVVAPTEGQTTEQTGQGPGLTKPNIVPPPNLDSYEGDLPFQDEVKDGVIVPEKPREEERKEEPKPDSVEPYSDDTKTEETKTPKKEEFTKRKNNFPLFASNYATTALVRVNGEPCVKIYDVDKNGFLKFLLGNRWEELNPDYSQEVGDVKVYTIHNIRGAEVENPLRIIIDTDGRIAIQQSSLSHPVISGVLQIYSKGKSRAILGIRTPEGYVLPARMTRMHVSEQAVTKKRRGDKVRFVLNRSENEPYYNKIKSMEALKGHELDAFKEVMVVSAYDEEGNFLGFVPDRIAKTVGLPLNWDSIEQMYESNTEEVELGTGVVNGTTVGMPFLRFDADGNVLYQPIFSGASKRVEDVGYVMNGNVYFKESGEEGKGYKYAPSSRTDLDTPRKGESERDMQEMRNWRENVETLHIRSDFMKGFISESKKSDNAGKAYPFVLISHPDGHLYMYPARSKHKSDNEVAALDGWMADERSARRIAEEDIELDFFMSEKQGGALDFLNQSLNVGFDIEDLNFKSEEDRLNATKESDGVVNPNLVENKTKKPEEQTPGERIDASQEKTTTTSKKPRKKKTEAHEEEPEGPIKGYNEDFGTPEFANTVQFPERSKKGLTLPEKAQYDELLKKKPVNFMDWLMRRLGFFALRFEQNSRARNPEKHHLLKFMESKASILGGYVLPTKTRMSHSTGMAISDYPRWLKEVAVNDTIVADYIHGKTDEQLLDELALMLKAVRMLPSLARNYSFRANGIDAATDQNVRAYDVAMMEQDAAALSVELGFPTPKSIASDLETLAKMSEQELDEYISKQISDEGKRDSVIKKLILLQEIMNVSKEVDPEGKLDIVGKVGDAASESLGKVSEDGEVKKYKDGVNETESSTDSKKESVNSQNEQNKDKKDDNTGNPPADSGNSNNTTGLQTGLEQPGSDGQGDTGSGSEAGQTYSYEGGPTRAAETGDTFITPVINLVSEESGATVSNVLREPVDYLTDDSFRKIESVFGRVADFKLPSEDRMPKEGDTLETLSDKGWQKLGIANWFVIARRKGKYDTISLYNIETGEAFNVSRSNLSGANYMDDIASKVARLKEVKNQGKTETNTDFPNVDITGQAKSETKKPCSVTRNPKGGKSKK